MVDRIVSIDERQVVTEKTVTGDEFFLAGHFPGSPIFPGAMMHELSLMARDYQAELEARLGPQAEHLERAMQMLTVRED